MDYKKDESDRLQQYVIKQATGTLSPNGRQINITIDELDTIINTFVIGTWNVEDSHATNKIYVDRTNNKCFVYINGSWVDLFAVTQNHLASLDETVSSLQSQITTEKGRVDSLNLTTASLQVQINANDDDISTLQNTTANHGERLGFAEQNISSLDTRVGNIETATDVGEIAVRVQAVEDKNSEQDGRLDAINDSMVTLSTAQYIEGQKRFNQAKVDMAVNPENGDITNYGFVNGKILSISQYVDNKSLSLSRYVDDVAHTLSSAMYHLDSSYVTLSSSQYVSGLKDFASIKTSQSPSVNSDVTNKQYVDTAIENKPSKYLGEQVVSYLPLDDTKVHLLDGNLLTATNYDDFVAYIENLYTSNPNLSCFTDETTWQANVTANGVCSKFVVDTTNHTVRLPKMGSQILTKSTAQSISAKTLSANIGLSTSVTLSGSTGASTVNIGKGSYNSYTTKTGASTTPHMSYNASSDTTPNATGIGYYVGANSTGNKPIISSSHSHTLSGAQTGTATLNQSNLNSIASNLSVSSNHFEDVYYYIVVKLN